MCDQPSEMEINSNPESETDVLSQEELEMIMVAMQSVKTTANGWGQIVLYVKDRKIFNVEFTSSILIKQKVVD